MLVHYLESKHLLFACHATAKIRTGCVQEIMFATKNGTRNLLHGELKCSPKTEQASDANKRQEDEKLEIKAVCGKP